MYNRRSSDLGNMFIKSCYCTCCWLVNTIIFHYFCWPFLLLQWTPTSSTGSSISTALFSTTLYLNCPLSCLPSLSTSRILTDLSLDCPLSQLPSISTSLILIALYLDWSLNSTALYFNCFVFQASPFQYYNVVLWNLFDNFCIFPSLLC